MLSAPFPIRSRSRSAGVRMRCNSIWIRRSSRKGTDPDRRSAGNRRQVISRIALPNSQKKPPSDRIHNPFPDRIRTFCTPRFFHSPSGKPYRSTCMSPFPLSLLMMPIFYHSFYPVSISKNKTLCCRNHESICIMASHKKDSFPHRTLENQQNIHYNIKD